MMKALFAHLLKHFIPDDAALGRIALKEPGRRNITRKSRPDAKLVLFPARAPTKSPSRQFLGDEYHTSGLRQTLLKGLGDTYDLNDFYIEEARSYKINGGTDSSIAFILLRIRDHNDPKSSNIMLLDKTNLRALFRDSDSTDSALQVRLNLENLIRPGRLYVLKEDGQGIDIKFEVASTIVFPNYTTLNIVEMLALVTTVLSPVKGHRYRPHEHSSSWRLDVMWEAMVHLNMVARLKGGEFITPGSDTGSPHVGVHAKTGFWKQVSYETVLLKAEIIQRQQRLPEVQDRKRIEQEEHSKRIEAHERRIVEQNRERCEIAQRREEMEAEESRLARKIQELQEKLAASGVQEVPSLTIR